MNSDEEGKRFTLEEIFDSQKFDDKSLKQPLWMRDQRRVSYLDAWTGSDALTVWIYDPSTGEKGPLFDPSGLVLSDGSKLEVHAYQWSHDETWLLFPERAPARFKPSGNLFAYELASGTLKQVTTTDLPQRGAKFSPTALTIGLVRAENIWTVDVQTGEERQWTFDGSETLYNGRLGWVYEEELALADGWRWSPDGRSIAYFQQDESVVPIVLLPQYEEPHSEPRVTRYPKAGDPNPETRVGVLSLDTGKTTWVGLDAERAHYVAQVQWTLDGAGILIQTLPRRQNRLTIWLADPATGAAREVLTEESDTWVEPWSWLHCLEGTDRFLWPSDRDGFRRIYLYDHSGVNHGAITPEGRDVEEIAGLCSAAQYVYYSTSWPVAMRRDIYRGDLSGGEPELLTAATPGWNRAWASPTGEHWIHWHSALGQPPTATLRNRDADALEVLSQQPGDLFAAYARQPWEFLEIPVSDGVTLNARMLKPAGFDPARRYPVVMYNYGGPGSQAVMDSWTGKGGLWHQLLASEGFIVLVADNRGTAGRGRDFKKQVFRRLGQLETQDQIDAARYAGSLPFVDAERIGIWGWSYGGYMACNCMLKGGGVFRAGAAVAPVTGWTLYDTIYTERYMETPEANSEGYREGSPAHFADRLEGGFLMIHGLMDDNVHFQNSARLVLALQDAKRSFETMFYPGKHHGIEDRHYHLYRTLTEFFTRHLKRNGGAIHEA